jgi:hypothetical protein
VSLAWYVGSILNRAVHLEVILSRLVLLGLVSTQNTQVLKHRTAFTLLEKQGLSSSTLEYAPTSWKIHLLRSRLTPHNNPYFYSYLHEQHQLYCLSELFVLVARAHPWQYLLSTALVCSRMTFQTLRDPTSLHLVLSAKSVFWPGLMALAPLAAPFTPPPTTNPTHESSRRIRGQYWWSSTMTPLVIENQLMLHVNSWVGRGVKAMNLLREE